MKIEPSSFAVDLAALIIKQPRQTRQAPTPVKRRWPQRGPRPSWSHPRCRPLGGVGLAGFVALAMRPGEWHSFADLRSRCRWLKRTSVTGIIRHMVRTGWLDRRAVGVDEVPTGHPMYLYRLTEAGERRRRWAAVLV